jgi:hypothetical protein
MIMTPKFDKLCETILEYFVSNAIAFYIDEFGEIHRVDRSHYEQIASDYELNDHMKEKFQEDFHETLDWYKDSEWCNDFVAEFCENSRIFCLVFDLNQRTLYIRAKANKLSVDQKNKIVEFCLSKNCDYKFDINAYG